MREVKVRSSLTSRGYLAFGPWNHSIHIYSLGQINLGSNPIGSLEIVSALNSFNYSESMWWYNGPYATQKYNPKVYSSAIHTIANGWNFDADSSRSNLGSGNEKSGSWP